MTKNEIIEDLYRSQLFDQLIIKLTSNHHLKDDLKQEVILILLQMNEDKIKTAWSDGFLIYLIINIIKKQFHSNTSPFHKKFRKNMSDNEIFDQVDDSIEYSEESLQRVLGLIEKLPLVDRELFKLYYKLDQYDRWHGELRDTNCNKETSSYRKISKKLKIDNVTISRSKIAQSHTRAIEQIKKQLQNGNTNDN